MAGRPRGGGGGQYWQPKRCGRAAHSLGLAGSVHSPPAGGLCGGGASGPRLTACTLPSARREAGARGPPGCFLLPVAAGFGRVDQGQYLSGRPAGKPRSAFGWSACQSGAGALDPAPAAGEWPKGAPWPTLCIPLALGMPGARGTVPPLFALAVTARWLQRSGAVSPWWRGSAGRSALARPVVRGGLGKTCSARHCQLDTGCGRGGGLWAKGQDRLWCRVSTLLGDWEGKPSDDLSGLRICSKQVHPCSTPLDPGLGCGSCNRGCRWPNMGS